MYSISRFGSCDVLSTSIKDESNLIPGGLLVVCLLGGRRGAGGGGGGGGKGKECLWMVGCAVDFDKPMPFFPLWNAFRSSKLDNPKLFEYEHG